MTTQARHPGLKLQPVPAPGTGGGGSAAVTVARRPPGLSAEMRRFTAGIRTVTALLTTMLMLLPGHAGTDGVMLLLVYGAWAGFVLGCEANGRPLRGPLLHLWIDVTWTVLLVQLAPAEKALLAITLVQPIVMASIGYGVRSASLLSVFAAAGLMLDAAGARLGLAHMIDTARLVPALGVLALGPVAAMLARPMNVLRERIDLVADIEARLDPRRGLASIAATLADALRTGLRADVAGLVLLPAGGAKAVLSTADDGAFEISRGVHEQFEALLVRLPHCPVSHVQRRWSGLLGGTRAHVDGATGAWSGDLHTPMVELARLLQVRSLRVVPLMRYGRVHGHLLVGSHERRGWMHDVDALADAAPELHRLIEQATLVDQLQDERAAHERVRIGRDLHDSAIQPYLGLKYAVESVALRVKPDNPLRADVEGLLELVNGEVAALREIISGLRSGEPRGDNAFVPAVRRQVRRFALLFGVEVALDCPDEVNTTRALAGALFHMVNEALNNVRKHTEAQHIAVRIEQSDTHIGLIVQDDGGRRRPAAAFRPRSLCERAESLGGAVSIDRADNGDTRVVITIPLLPRRMLEAA